MRIRPRPVERRSCRGSLDRLPTRLRRRSTDPYDGRRSTCCPRRGCQALLELARELDKSSGSTCHRPGQYGKATPRDSTEAPAVAKARLTRNRLPSRLGSRRPRSLSETRGALVAQVVPVLGRRRGQARRGALGWGEDRLALARLVVSSANVLLLDEPTSNLDPASRPEILAALRRYRAP